MSEAIKKRKGIPFTLMAWACLAAGFILTWWKPGVTAAVLFLCALILTIAADLRAEIREARHDR